MDDDAENEVIPIRLSNIPVFFSYLGKNIPVSSKKYTRVNTGILKSSTFLDCDCTTALFVETRTQ